MLCEVLAGLWLVASPALAEIKASLETPNDGQAVSGKSVVSGWAFSTTTNPVTVTLRINGTNTNVVIPCCGPRADVQAGNSGAPPNTGFGLLQNYGVFDPAKLKLIGVRITASGETDKVIDHDVTVAKPGNAEFLNDFILGPNVNIAVDGDDIVIGGAQVTFTGGSAKTNLRIEYATNLQSPAITVAFTGTNANLFNQVQTIFTNRCASAEGCHAGGSPAQGQNLSAGSSWKNIVAVRSTEDPSRPRVSPGDAERSYLYQKIIAGGDIAPGTSRMPQGCAGSGCLSQDDIDKIEQWINDGARPPQ
ncbi:MAG TPA: hypothetical protein VGX03_08210 [Candidatus Binatia bacterium]|nr:hypothetical protein [Candidatus Binatia bacterium]